MDFLDKFKKTRSESRLLDKHDDKINDRLSTRPASLAGEENRQRDTYKMESATL